MPYLLSNHARRRIAQRGICPMAVANALENDPAYRQEDRFVYYDRATRVSVVVKRNVILTVYRATRRQVKRTHGRQP